MAAAPRGRVQAPPLCSKKVRVTLTVAELATIVDALKWNVAKQRWLKEWQKTRRDGEVAANGHKLRQKLAQHVLDNFEMLLFEATNE